MSVLVQEARRRTYKPAAERREQILDCALEAFASCGYHQTSIADVCKRAGIGRGTLYQYFEDKRSLLVALAERIADRITHLIETRPQLDVAPGTKPSGEDAVRFIENRFVQVLNVIFENDATARVILKAGRGADTLVDQTLRRVDETVISVVEKDLRQAIAAGIVRPLDEKLVARFFIGGIEKLVLSYLDDDRPVDIAAIAREAALLEARGILAN